MTRLVASWRCLDPACPAHIPTVDASMSVVDKAAEKHTKSQGHGTIAGGVAT